MDCVVVIAVNFLTLEYDTILTVPQSLRRRLLHRWELYLLVVQIVRFVSLSLPLVVNVRSLVLH